MYQTSVVHFLVWPNDLDTNLHMNNGSYLKLMDLGRFDLTVRIGLGRAVAKYKWAPVLSSVNIIYRHSLLPFQSYQLHSRIIGWDEKWFYMEQRFICHGDIYASALVKGVFKQERETVPVRRVADILEIEFDTLSLPDYIAQWDTLESHLRDKMKSDIDTIKEQNHDQIT